MGKAITYCNRCQNQIREADFDRGSAFRIEDRAYCQACSGEALKSLPPEKVGALLKEIASRGRKAAAAPPPPTPTAPPAPPKPPVLLIAGGVAGVLVVVAVLIFALSGSKEPPPVASEVRKPAVDEGVAVFEPVAAFAATSTDPEAILQRCQEARPKLRGTKYESRLEEIEKQAKETWERRLKDARFDAFLQSVATMRKDDPGFGRRAEILSLIKTGALTAGPRKPAVDQLLADYDRSFLEAARAAAEKVKATANEFAGQGRFRAAAAATDDYPPAFRDTDFGKSIVELKASYEGKAAEQERAAAAAARLEAERRAALWNAWKIISEPGDEGLPKLLPAWGNRSEVQKLRPPCSFERPIDVPAGKGAVLSLWAGREEGRAGWTLSVTVDRKPVATVPVGPDGRLWKPVLVDLSAFAGKKPLLRLEGTAVGSSLEPLYVGNLDLRIVASAGEAATLIAREQDPLAAWTISCSSNSQYLPAILPEYRGRSNVTQTHPFSLEKPGTLQREVSIPAKRHATLSFWVNHAVSADWELRVVVDGTTLKKELIGGDATWRRFTIDLSAYAGKSVRIILENVANDWSSEFAYWSDITIDITE